MKALFGVLAGLALLAGPAHAQRRDRWGVVNVGVVSPAGTTKHHVAITLGVTCSPTYTGVCPGFEFGGDFSNHPGGDLFGVNVGYSVAFGTRRQSSLVPRVGLSILIEDDEHASTFGGISAGLGLRHAVTSKMGWSVDFNWRHYRGFDWPTLSVGLGLHP